MVHLYSSVQEKVQNNVILLQIVQCGSASSCLMKHNSIFMVLFFRTEVSTL